MKTVFLWANSRHWEFWFFLLSFGVMLNCLPITFYQSNLLHEADWRFPFNFYPISSSNLYLTLSWLTILATGALCFAPIRVSRLLGIVMWTVWLALFFSFDRIYNIYHGFFLVSVGLFFAQVLGAKSSLEYGTAACLSMYLSSGMWKLYYLISGKDIWDEAAKNLPNHIAYGIAQTANPSGWFLQLFLLNPSLSTVVWILVIILQISLPLLVILAPTWIRVAALFTLASFHYFAQVLLVVPKFWPQIALLILFGLIQISQLQSRKVL